MRREAAASWRCTCRAKPFPAETGNWPEIVRDCYRLFAEESWLPVASLVLGLPGERAEDVIKTTELVESLMDYTGLMLPLFFTTIADTKLGGTRGFARKDALPEHWQLVGLCLEYNLSTSRSCTASTARG